MNSNQIRKTFIDFFRERGHQFIPSSPVIPEDDPTLLFANAGMNQFKNIFLGLKEAPVCRAVNSQKCIRAGGKHNDLEVVGKDGYHHTFFEMLGSWSFGDYYKKDAIIWAWELLTEVFKLPKDKLYATVHESDKEAFEIWQTHTDIDNSHISYQGDKDNFWEMGDMGPCGPCSEIHIDRGTAHCELEGVEGHVCAVNGDCSRFIELWNLVFIQYNREADRSLVPLKNKYVDTGAGFERLVQVLQDVDSNYETDLFMPIIGKIAELSGVKYSPETGVSHRVIADHVRCLCFALADGGFPSNEGRGYVLRRILRRASRHGRLLGFAEPFMFHLVDTVSSMMGDHFPELKGREAYIRMVIKAEEERFNAALDKGLEHFDEILARLEGDSISGKDAFKLYDTFGFPLDLTLIMAQEKGLGVDTEGFEAQMEAQRDRARKSSKFAWEASDEEWTEFSKPSPTQFLGYEQSIAVAKIQRYRLSPDGLLHLQLDQSPFYAESGGQVSDTGVIFNDDFEMRVTQVSKKDDYFIHSGELIRGAVSEKPVTAEIDLARRRDIMRNHTATHLLHKALRDVLGDHVQQKGSLVSPDYLRFDFTHMRALTADEIQNVEKKVNEAVRQDLPVSVVVKGMEEARKDGAIALFGEKYSEMVRVVSVQDFSMELCGGTHVSSSGEIGFFKIGSESSIAAGIRRIEALTGRGADEFVQSLQNRIKGMAQSLQVPEKALEQKLEGLQNRVSELEHQLKKLEAGQSGAEAQELLSQIRDMGDFRLLSAVVEADAAKLRELGDILKDRAKDAISVLFARNGDKVSIVSVVGPGLKERFHAGNIVKTISQHLGGKGGGRPDSAMGGGSNPEKIAEISEKLPQIIQELLKQSKNS